jgi:putative transposase
MNSFLPQRRSIRWRGYDYSQCGVYFITVCVEKRLPLLADVVNSQCVLEESGEMIQKMWLDLPQRFSSLIFDEYVIMPNHFHGIIIIENAVTREIRDTNRATTGRATTRVAPTVGDIVGAWKSLTTNAYIEGVKNFGWTPFPQRLWQRNYYERVVRTECELNAIREYIAFNPVRWHQDPENPNPQGQPS